MPKTSVPATPTKIAGRETPDQAQQRRDFARPLGPQGQRVEDAGGDRTTDEEERRGDVKHQQPLGSGHEGERTLAGGWNRANGICVS